MRLLIHLLGAGPGFFLTGWLLLISCLPAMAQAPVNDDCANALAIPIPAAGFGLGNFTSAQTNLTNATVQTGEAYAPAIFVAGLDKKSVWYKFSLPTIRAVRVTLTQPGTTITAGDAGFAVYQTAGCLPTNANISTKLTPIVTFGNTYHPCVPAGEYLVQVSAKLAANGPITVQLEISDQTGAAYDHPNQAYAFGVAGNFARYIDFDTECQSIEDSTEVCTSLFNYRNYHKSAWFTFTTPAYFDHMIVMLSGTGSPSYFSGTNVLRTFGYTLYKGNAVNTPIASLQTVDGCDSLRTTGYVNAIRQYRCDQLERNTTYSVQLFFEKSFSEIVRLGLVTSGTTATAAPLPVASMPASNKMGVLNLTPAGIVNTITDTWGCNSRHSVTSCNPALPGTGVTVNGLNYNLSSFATFTLDKAAAINFRAVATQCGPNGVIRLFKQTLTNNCADLDTANLVATVPYNTLVDCLAPGNYVVQILGRDMLTTSTFYYYDATRNYEQCFFTNLGTRFRLDLTGYTRKAANNYSLNGPGAYDTINRVGNAQQPLLPGVAYTSNRDTIGCLSTVRPSDTTCSPVNDKVIYRQFAVADSGTVAFTNMLYSNNPPFRYKLYSGDANALATAQNAFAFPDRIVGLKPQSLCFDGYTYCDNKAACVVPGTYTFTSLGSVGDVGKSDRPTFTFSRTRTLHNSPFTAQDMGSIMDTLGVNGGTKKSDADFWSCDDNAVPINGYQPCAIGGRPATKAIYRQFYLKGDALVRIAGTGISCSNYAYGTKTLFYGKATDGFGALSPVGNQWNCFATAQTANGCTFLPAGWYTVVSYGTGPSYDSATRLVNIGGRYNSHVGFRDEFNITITPACPGPKFNRPYKASINSTTSQPHLVTWGNRVGSTAAYPRTDSIFSLPTESFNCTLDTPFASHPIKTCEAAANRVAYYVFRTTQVSFLQINTGGLFAAVYDKDVRTDSMQFATAAPIQQCNSNAGFIQFCFFQPGTYTLVVYAKDANSCGSVTPRIYIDQVGYSRFDYANNAYDFDVVPPNATYHFGKVGDVNPLHSGRKPSTDFFYCTTGAFTTDPANPVCNTRVNPNVYNNGPNKPLYDSIFPASNGVARRNLWYTFVAADPGTVRIKVENKTIGRGLQPRFAVYQSNVNGILPFADVVNNGQVDSTLAQGLSFVTMNYITSYYCYNAPDNISFYRDPCTSVPTRYYILVENVNSFPNEVGGQLPNTQVEVSIRIDSVNLIQPKYDHYYTAANMGTVGVGTFTGPTDNYSCATRDAKDPVYNTYANCTKTLWYKFTSTITGNVRFRIKVNNTNSYDYQQVQLLKEVIPGDSTTNGLKIQTYSTVSGAGGTWAQSCVSVGTYYLLLPGCGRVNEYVYPEIELIEAVGDYCLRAVPSAINGPGAATSTVLVNCHTIGTDYGEFGPQLTCPQNALTGQYKSSWFRLDIGGTDTLDVTTYLVENTNAASSDIKYRLMTGDCGAMQEQSCVLDALTQNTYQCMVPGQSYYVQVFTPLLKSNAAVTGTIDLKISAIAHADTCAPLTNCLASANFNTSFNCNTDDSVKFVNFSTYGTSIGYQWDFGYNGLTSTAVSPSVFYPALPTDQTYTVKLVVSNNSCGQKDSVTRTVTVPGRPFFRFGNDIDQCNSTAPITLKASSHPGATYLWQNNSAADSFRISNTGVNNYWVRITYNGCSTRDTIRVLISPIAARPVQQVILCTDSVLINVNRGFGATYRWNTGATTSSIYMSQPGFYWADITYNNCVYRDSFEVSNVRAAKPLGNDTTVCLSGTGYLLDATTTGAVSYTWQNGRTTATFPVTTAGQYIVTINFGNCTIKDTILVAGYPAPVNEVTDTSICYGSTLLLPWGATATVAGSYRDTLRYAGGCDSVVRRINLAVIPRPSIGRDTTICFTKGSFTINAATSGAVGYTWQDGDTSAVYTISTPGLYWVAIDYGTCSVRDSVVISDFPAPVVTTLDTSICFGQAFTLPWGNMVTLGGNYRDTLYSVNGCDSLVRVVNLLVNTRPSLGRDSAISTCTGNTINLTSIYATTGLSFNWTVGGAPFTTPANANTPGVYRLVATNAGGCSDTALVTLSFSGKPALGNDTALVACQGGTINLTQIYNTTGLTSTWSANGNIVPNPATVTAAGQYRLVVANAVGCMDTALINLTLLTASVLGNDTAIAICQGAVVNLGSLYATAGLNTNWSLNGNPVANPTTIATGGVYRLIVSNVSGCKDTALVTVSVTAAPSLGSDKAVSICTGETVNLLSVFDTSNVAIAWTYNNQPVNNPLSVAAAGLYRLIATNAAGCSDTALLTISVAQKPAPGNDTLLTSCTGSGINLAALYNTTGLNTNWFLNGNAVNNPISVTTAGNYQLIARSVAGCSDTAQVTVIFNPTPSIGKDTSLAICSGGSVNLTGLYPTSGLTINWRSNGNPVINPTAIQTPGNYTLMVTASTGCNDTAVVNLITKAKPFLGADTMLAICQGNSISLPAMYNTQGLTTAWTLNGNTVTNLSSVTVAGSYRLLVTNSEGCADTAILTLTTTPKPALGNDITTVACEGTVHNLTSLYNTTGLTTQWAYNGNNMPGPVSAGVAGQYRLIAINANGCADTALVTLQLTPKPSLGPDTALQVCPGNTVNLATLFNTGNNSNRWTLNSVAVTNINNVSVAGLYQLITATPAGCADTVLVTLTVATIPILVINNPPVVCAPQTVNLTNASVTAGSSPGLTYTYWQDAAATIAYPNAASAASGNWFIKGTNNAGCSSIGAVPVTWYALPLVSAGNDQQICTNGMATLRASVTNSNAPVTYQWAPAITGGIVNPTAPVTSVQPTSTQQYILTVTDGYGCNFNLRDTVLVTVRPPVSAFAGNDTIASTGVPQQLRASGGVSYLWSPPTGLNNRLVPNPMATLFTDSIQYVVEVKDIAGCVGYDTIVIRVYDGITYYVPNAFTPNGDGKNDIFKPVGVGILTTEVFRIFNRYGEIVFETNQWNRGWDGNYKGIAQGTGNYVWYVKGIGRNGKVIEMRGNVLLLK